MVKGVLSNFPRYMMGLTAMVLACLTMYAERQSLPIFFASVFFFAICVTDTLHARIPNILTFSFALVGLGYNVWDAGTTGLISSLVGFALGLGLFLIPFIMGGMGAGDVKALAALGALVGPATIFNVFLYTALFGGAMSLLHYACNRNLLQSLKQTWHSVLAFSGSHDTSCLAPAATAEKLRFPYAAAIAFGYFTYVARGGIL